MIGTLEVIVLVMVVAVVIEFFMIVELGERVKKLERSSSPKEPTP